jgi:hypothetical protein
VVIVDSSHVLMPGTDVDILLSHVIPHLPGGVHVVFHDIFLPFAYPAAWPFTSYNEQNAVAPLLQGRADIVFSSAWAVRAMSERLSRTWIGRQPLEPGALESALILRLG